MTYLQPEPKPKPKPKSSQKRKPSPQEKLSLTSIMPPPPPQLPPQSLSRQEQSSQQPSGAQNQLIFPPGQPLPRGVFGISSNDSFYSAISLNLPTGEIGPIILGIFDDSGEASKIFEKAAFRLNSGIVNTIAEPSETEEALKQVSLSFFGFSLLLVVQEKRYIIQGICLWSVNLVRSKVESWYCTHPHTTI